MNLKHDDNERALLAKADKHEDLARALRDMAWAHYVARHGRAYVIVSTFRTPDDLPRSALN